LWTLNKSNYAMSGQALTLRTVGKRAAWHCVEDLEKPDGGDNGKAQDFQDGF